MNSMQMQSLWSSSSPYRLDRAGLRAQDIAAILRWRWNAYAEVYQPADVMALPRYHVVAAGCDADHLRKMADDLAHLFENRDSPWRFTGRHPGSKWILLDVGDFFVHLLTRELRNYYGEWGGGITIVKRANVSLSEPTADAHEIRRSHARRCLQRIHLR